ncbi:MAG: cation transporter [Firmicutes bacterium]|nr:cation transporter [Bacillota bacterium]
MEFAKPAQFERDARRVSLVGIVGNLILTLFKAAAGILAHSGAMVSDAVHSASDVLSTIIALVGIKIAAREEDESHPYGHERFECVAAIVLAVILFFTGFAIGREAITAITTDLTDASQATVPGVLALIAAVISIVSKEAMYRYTVHYANRYDSSALKASAWDHRSDAFSSIGALIGIGGARLGFPVLDPIASILICLFILKAAYEIFREAVDKMVDRSCSEETEAAIRACAERQPGVEQVDMLRTREFGNRIYVDIEIGADGGLSLYAGHVIAELVHDAVEKEFPKVKHIMVHVNPAGPGGNQSER